ncbi:ribosome maturation factor RimM [Aurantivibrio plasticivorans]
MTEIKPSGSSLRTVGKLGAPNGVLGWMRLQSFTEPSDQILEYEPWWLKTRHGVKQASVEQVKPHSDGLLVKLANVSDRDAAKAFTNVEIAVSADQFPALPVGEYYWHQLEGLRVVACYQGVSTPIGRVTKLLETGANDVLVVQGAPDSTAAPSIDKRERLVPYLPEQVVTKIDLEQGQIDVEWDPDF